MPRGGKRPGSGRKPSDARARAAYEVWARAASCGVTWEAQSEHVRGVWREVARAAVKARV